MADGDDAAVLTDAGTEVSANGGGTAVAETTTPPAEQGGNGAAATATPPEPEFDLGLGAPTSFDDLLASDSLSEDAYAQVLERSPALRKMVEGKLDQNRLNAERRRESQLRRQVSTGEGQRELYASALAKIEGMTPELVQRAVNGLGPVGEALRAVMRNDVFQEIVSSGEGYQLTAEEQQRLGEPQIRMGDNGELEYLHDSEALLDVTLSARGRAFALDQDATDLIKNHPQSALARTTAKIARDAVQRELRAQGITQAAGATGQQPGTPGGNGQTGALSVEEIASMSDDQLGVYLDGLTAEQRAELKTAIQRNI